MRLRRFDRDSGQRRALLRQLTTSVVMCGKVTTTEAKAKAVVPIVEKMVSLGVRGDVQARRQAAAFLLGARAVQKLFGDVAPRYAGRSGGYTRTTKLAPRRGDAAPMAVVELV
ncbi:MAG: 50S ribosomal protein L17 [Firmicutes bacterium]|nr:50S ribosomal protein L17 [Bacillota bacterium]